MQNMNVVNHKGPTHMSYTNEIHDLGVIIIFMMQNLIEQHFMTQNDIAIAVFSTDSMFDV